MCVCVCVCVRMCVHVWASVCVHVYGCLHRGGGEGTYNPPPPPPPPQINEEIPTNQWNKSVDRFFGETASQ